MATLKSRDKFIPNGFRFRQPEIRWEAPAGQSFNALVGLVIAARKSNPAMMTRFRMSIDPGIVADEVDRYNASICETMGWHAYVNGGRGGPPVDVPFTPQPYPPRHGILARARNVAVGSKVLIEWLASGAEAVPVEQATERATVCAACPLNGKGGLSDYFTVPVSAAIQESLNQRREWKLTLPIDEDLGVCQACDCPMKLKIWMPIEKFLPSMLPAARSELAPGCWIRSEGNLPSSEK